MTKKNKVHLEVIGGNAESVTGSATLINNKYLFEFGLIQDGHTPLENYHLNSKLLHKVKPQDIDVIMISHLHADHICLIPALYKYGKCNARIIVPKNSTIILKEMWLDSAYIHERDVEIINLKNKNYEPLYTESTVFEALKYVEEIESDEIVKINDELSIRYTDAGHILLSKQAEVYVTTNSNVKKILFTGDLGNICTQNERIFVEQFKPVNTANIVIGEATYAAKGRETTFKTLQQDIGKIKAAIEQYCIDNNNRILIPTFSLDRMPFMIWIIYSLFGHDDNFNIPVIIDSPLANRLLDCYSSILSGDAKDKFDEMMSWKNLKRVITPEESKLVVSDKKSKIVLASSGMLTAGRSINYVKSFLPNSNDLILFIGYASNGTLADKIKHSKDNKTININGKPYKNKAQIIDLHSFSSHMQHSDLIKYYKSINCEKIYLVHSSMEDRIEFKEELQTEINKCLKSTRVIAVNSGVKINV